MKRIQYVLLSFLLYLCIGSADANLLQNPGFEEGFWDDIPHWNREGNAYIESWAAETGAQGLAFYGWENEGRIAQEVSAAGLSNYTFSASGLVETSFPLDQMEVEIRLEFCNEEGIALSTHTTAVSGPDEWTRYSLTAVAPPDTVVVRVVMAYQGEKGSGGAILWDNAELVSESFIEGPGTYVSKSGTHVYPFTNWTTAANTIQAAIDAAPPYDTVYVNDGIYTQAVHIVVDKPLFIQSVNGPAFTIVDSGESSRGFYVISPLAVIDGFTVTGGFQERVNDNAFGAGVYMPNGGIIRNCVIAGNTANGAPPPQTLESGYARGGGIYIAVTGLVENCEVYDNQAYRGAASGGGIYADGKIIIRNSTIRGNTAEGGQKFYYYGQSGLGGGLYLAGGARVEHSVITNNFCYAGSGMYAGQSIGAGIYAIHSTISASIISENRAQGPSSPSRGNSRASGAGLFLNGSRMESCLVTDNETDVSHDWLGETHGGGVRAIGTSVVANCTIAHNRIKPGSSVSDHSKRTGGGLYLESESGGVAVNCVIWGNHSEAGLGHDWDADIGAISYSCTFPNPQGTANIAVDPRFVDPVNGNYRLDITSPGIDTGTNQAWMAEATDVDGNPRILFGRVDMGCYELTEPADSDGDGIPNWWKIQYYGGPTNVAASHVAANLINTVRETYIAGLDPTDPSSLFAIEASAPTQTRSDHYEITVSTQPGREYVIHYRTEDLTGPGEWKAFQNAAAGTWLETNDIPGTHTFVDDGTPATSGLPLDRGRRYYRVRVYYPEK